MGIEALRPFNDVVDITVFTSDINLITTYGSQAMYVQVINAGSGTFSFVTGKGNTRTLTVATGDEIGPLAIKKILLATNVTKLRVYFQ